MGGDPASLDAAFADGLRAANAAGLEAMQCIALADRLNAAGRPADVVSLYQAWLASNTSPASHVIQFNLGVTLSQSERLAEAEAVYRAAILQKPDFSQAWFNLGAVVERLGRKEHALTIWQSMLDHPLAGPGLNRDLYLLVVNGMGRLLDLPKMLAQPCDRGARVENHLRSIEPQTAGPLGKMAVVANVNANLAHSGFKDRVAEIARPEIEFFPKPR